MSSNRAFSALTSRPLKQLTIVGNRGGAPAVMVVEANGWTDDDLRTFVTESNIGASATVTDVVLYRLDAGRTSAGLKQRRRDLLRQAARLQQRIDAM